MIFLSAGHYPSRPGACFEDFCEHAEAVKWVNEVAGVIDTDVVIVPTGSLKSKALFINGYDIEGSKSICIEIHFNSAMRDGEHVGEGTECLYMPESQRGAYLAHQIQNAIVESTGWRDRGIKEGWYRMNKLNGPDYFLSKTAYPAVIVEPEFIQFPDRISAEREKACGKIAEKLIEVHNDFNN